MLNIKMARETIQEEIGSVERMLKQAQKDFKRTGDDALRDIINDYYGKISGLRFALGTLK